MSRTQLMSRGHNPGSSENFSGPCKSRRCAMHGRLRPGSLSPSREKVRAYRTWQSLVLLGQSQKELWARSMSGSMGRQSGEGREQGLGRRKLGRQPRWASGVQTRQEYLETSEVKHCRWKACVQVGETRF